MITAGTLQYLECISWGRIIHTTKNRIYYTSPRQRLNIINEPPPGAEIKIAVLNNEVKYNNNNNEYYFFTVT